MIHRLVDATVPSIIKSDLHAHGRVEGAGSGLRFLKLQLGTELRTCPEGMLHQHWRCALEVLMCKFCYCHVLKPALEWCVSLADRMALTF